MDYDSLYQIPSASVFLDSYRDDMSYRDAVWLTAHNAFANNFGKIATSHDFYELE